MKFAVIEPEKEWVRGTFVTLTDARLFACELSMAKGSENRRFTVASKRRNTPVENPFFGIDMPNDEFLNVRDMPFGDTYWHPVDVYWRGFATFSTPAK